MDWARRFDRPLPRGFYRAPTAVVARRLLGQLLLRRWRGRWLAARIVETEAYVGNDPANHAYRGPTRRNRSMFEAPGTLYVYRIHQVCCANIVTRAGEAVLLRAAQPLVAGLGSTSGPGRLCRAFRVRQSHDGQNVSDGLLRIADGAAERLRIVRAPRVGIRRATDRRLRFAIERCRWVSSPRP